MIKYHIENFSPRGFFGWAFDDEPGAGFVDVVVSLRGGRKTVKANLFRDHLRRAAIGNGEAGFEFTLAPGESFDPAGSIRLQSLENAVVLPMPEAVREVLDFETKNALFLNSRNSRLFRCVLALIIRNEAVYVPEWIEYHRMLGVDHFLVFDNGSRDGLLDVLAPYRTLGIVSLIDWPNITAASRTARTAGWVEQDVAYAGAIRLLAGRADWVGFIDSDEFVVLAEDAGTSVLAKDAHANLPEVLDSTGSTVVSLSWRTFGSAGHIAQPEGLAIESFVMREADPETATTKVFLRPEHADFVLNTHKMCVATPAGKLFGRTSGGAPVMPHDAVAADYSRIFIHHYHTRSREEYERKARRGWPDNTSDKNFDWETRFHAYDRNDVRDERLVPHGTEVRRRLKAMKSLGAPALPPSLRPDWLVTLPATLMVYFSSRWIASGQITVRGFIVDLLRPNRKAAIAFHDGYGSLIHERACDTVSNVLVGNRVSDGAYGFDVTLPSVERSYLVCEDFAAAIWPHRQPGAAKPDESVRPAALQG